LQRTGISEVIILLGTRLRSLEVLVLDLDKLNHCVLWLNFSCLRDLLVRCWLALAASEDETEPEDGIRPMPRGVTGKELPGNSRIGKESELDDRDCSPR
jgi:hypothetical protein